MLMVGYDEVEI